MLKKISITISALFFIASGYAIKLTNNHHHLQIIKKSNTNFYFEAYKPQFFNIEDFGNRLEIGSTSRSGAGFLIKTENKSSQPQLILVSGRNIEERASVRIRHNSEEPTYIPAPDGDFYWTIGPGETVELLYYRDKRFIYSINEISKKQCPECIEKHALKTRILKEIPSLLKTLNEGRWEEALTLLLDFSSKQADLGLTIRSDAAYTYSPNDLTYLFANDSVEGSCGLFADYYRKILKEFGFESATLDFGIDTEMNLTHVSTIVLAPDGNYYIFDPTFNATYHTGSGELADIEDILGPQEVKFMEVSLLRDIWVKESGADEFLFHSDYLNKKNYNLALCTKKNINKEDYVFCPDVPYSSEFLIEKWKDRLALAGFQTNSDLLTTFLKKGSVYSINSENPKLKLELIRLLKNRGVKLEIQ